MTYRNQTLLSQNSSFQLKWAGMSSPFLGEVYDPNLPHLNPIRLSLNEEVRPSSRCSNQCFSGFVFRSLSFAGCSFVLWAIALGHPSRSQLRYCNIRILHASSNISLASHAISCWWTAVLVFTVLAAMWRGCSIHSLSLAWERSQQFEGLEGGQIPWLSNVTWGTWAVSSKVLIAIGSCKASGIDVVVMVVSLSKSWDKDVVQLYEFLHGNVSAFLEMQ